MKKKLLGVTALVGTMALVLMGGSAALAAEGDSITITPSTVEPGELFTVSGEGCPGEVLITSDGEPVTVQPGSDGMWSVELTAPGKEGSLPVTASCELGNPDQEFHYADGTVTVVAPFVAPAWAEIGEITREGCVVSIPVMTGVGTFDLEVWDDGERIDVITWESDNPEGTHIVQWTINQPAADAAPGVAFAVFENGDSTVLAEVPNYEYPDEVAQQCAPQDDPAPVNAPTPPKKVETAAAGSTQAGASGMAGLLMLTAVGTAVMLLRRETAKQ